MNVDRVRPFRRAFALAAATALVTTGLAACGGGDDDAQTVDISVTEKGKASEITAPESVEAGLAEITSRTTARRATI
jgi:hypothetical protein